MKRQRNAGAHNTNATKAEGTPTKTTAMTAMGKKKTKKAIEKMEEDRKNNVGESGTMSQQKILDVYDHRPWLWSVVDEQMSWGSIWPPIWDVDCMGEAIHSEMFSDVVWDDDIWNLKSINEIPHNNRKEVA